MSKQTLILQERRKRQDLNKIPAKIRRVRLKDTKIDYRAGNLDQSALNAKWDQWRKEDDYIVLRAIEDDKKIALKCAKRGNDVYRYRVASRFSAIEELGDDLDIDLFDSNDVDKETNCLFVTLTYDTKRCSKMQAWDDIGKEYNRWMMNLKRKFGKFQAIRCFESFANGYPHIHALVWFESSNFQVYNHPNKEQSNHKDEFDSLCGSTYRITNKSDFESWHSHVDVLAVNNIGRAIRYITKYLRKSHNDDSSKYTTTQANLWIHGKRAFSVSTEFAEKLRKRLEAQLHNSNKKIGQLDLSGQSVEKTWEFLGVYGFEELQKCNKSIKNNSWTLEIDKLPLKAKDLDDLSSRFKVDRVAGLFSANYGMRGRLD